MSLCRLAAQLSAVQALRGRTAAGDNIRDSEVGLIKLDADGNMETREQKPFVNVFCDDVVGEEGSRDLLDGGRLTMAFEFGVTGSMPLLTADGSYLVDAESGDIVVADLEKPSDAGLNIVVETIERQIRTALVDARNPWSEIWKRFVSGPFKVDSQRGASAKNGVRFGARCLKITGVLRADPVFGADVRPTSAWGLFLAALPGSQVEHLQPTFEKLLGIGSPAADHILIARRHGQTSSEAAALGYAPAFGGGA